jgi:hypothetical protein
MALSAAPFRIVISLSSALFSVNQWMAHKRMNNKRGVAFIDLAQVEAALRRQNLRSQDPTTPDPLRCHLPVD